MVQLFYPTEGKVARERPRRQRNSVFPSGKRVRIEINNHRGTVSRSFLNSAFSPGQEFVNLRLCPFGERAVMPGQARRREGEEARRREKEMKRKGVDCRLVWNTERGMEVEGMATGRCPKTRLCYCPPSTFSLAP